MKILLAASGGGHVRQILDLEPFWSQHESVFATEDTALGRSIASKRPVRFFAHFAFGQRRTASWGRLLRSGLANLRDSWRIVREVKPDLVISTGAGSALFTVIFGRLRGAEVVVIESFARFEAPSLFGKLAHRFATHKIVQSSALDGVWPGAHLCDPFEIVDAPRPDKTATAVVTVGTVMPFDRLVAGVAGLQAAGHLPEAVWAQVGEGGATSDGFTCVESSSFEEMQARLADAELLFCHGGTGSLVTGLRAGCRVVAMPRDPEFREHYDDHQFEIVEAFAARGLIQMAKTVEELPEALVRAREMPVRRATTNYAKLIALLNSWYPVGKSA
ncbi:MAG: glycosyltransferase [Sphingomonadaceae bacterium]